MKVLQINSVCGIGSTGRIATEIHATLKELGHESYIAYGRNNPLNCESTIKIGNKWNNYLHVAKTRILDLHGFGSKNATEKFITQVKKLDPDIIHLHNIHGYYINIEILFAYLKEANKPIVWTLHDCWPFTGHCAYFDYSGCECWKIDGDQKCIQKRSYPSSLFINNSKQNFWNKKRIFTGVNNLTIVTPSNWLAKLVKQSFLKDYNVKVINNGVNFEIFKPTTSDIRLKNNLEDKFILLGVANKWEKRKGYEYFIKLSSLLEEDEVIILVGLDEKQIGKLPSNIIGISKTDTPQKLAEIYSTADVFINPTLEDNFPTTNLEALACATPVITFNTGGSTESIEDGKSGIITEKNNLDNLVKSLKKIKTTDIKTYSENARKRAVGLYNSASTNKKYTDLYHSLIKEN